MLLGEGGWIWGVVGELDVENHRGPMWILIELQAQSALLHEKVPNHRGF